MLLTNNVIIPTPMPTVCRCAQVSKAGGTTFCQLAEKNGCRTKGFKYGEGNCLIPRFNDRVGGCTGAGGWVGWVGRNLSGKAVGAVAGLSCGVKAGLALDCQGSSLPVPSGTGWTDAFAVVTATARCCCCCYSRTGWTPRCFNGCSCPGSHPPTVERWVTD